MPISENIYVGTKKLIEKKLSEGHTVRSISHILSVSEATVRKWIKTNRASYTSIQLLLDECSDNNLTKTLPDNDSSLSIYYEKLEKDICKKIDNYLNHDGQLPLEALEFLIRLKAAITDQSSVID